jgi:hypothetical protein
VTANPGQTAFATYGVWRRRSLGTYVITNSNCTTTSASLTAWSPFFVGWNTWTA